MTTLHTQHDAHRSIFQTPRQSSAIAGPLRRFKEAQSYSTIAGSLIDEQLRLEQDAVVEGVNKYRRLSQLALKRGEAATLRPVERFLVHWYIPLRQAIRADQRALRRAEKVEGDNAGKAIAGPFMLLLNAERLAVITLHEAINGLLQSSDGEKVVTLAHAVGRAVQAEALLDTMKKQRREAVRDLERKLKGLTVGKVNWYANKNLEEEVWSQTVRVQVGTRLLWHMQGIATSAGYGDDFKSAMKYESRRTGHKTTNYFRLSDETFRLIAEGEEARALLMPRYLPMVIKPLPWSKGKAGGYIRLRHPLVSRMRPDQRAMIEEAEMPAMYAGINYLNSIPWRINHRILDTVKALWEKGGVIAGLPPVGDIPMPPPLESGTEKEIAYRKFERWDTWHKNLNRASERKVFGYKLWIAEQFSHHLRIWFPHQLDFRGRCYPVPRHLNYQGDDLCRGLLEFATGRPVTDRALWWLKINAANHYGYDDCSFDDRVSWADANWDSIIASARAPEDTEFWRTTKPKVDHPWQFLAACIELDRVTSDPKALTHQPVHIDGSCNGLQHYAALSRDPTSARLVNMIPTDRPRKLYRFVMERVKEQARKDAQAGDLSAITVEPHIDKDIVKPPSMTFFYNVTPIGARRQVQKELEERKVETHQALYLCSNYLAKLILHCVEQTCPAAVAVMDWLARCARAVAAEPSSQNLAWVTPLGFPVVQPYRLLSDVKIRTVLQEVQVAYDDDRQPPAVGEHVDGSPPNTIHSFDQTHMFMTALESERRAMHFAAIHDDYCSHATDMDILKRITPEQFVALHSTDQVAALYEQFKARYPGVEIPQPPPPGNYDINTVLKSEYFFS